MDPIERGNIASGDGADSLVSEESSLVRDMVESPRNRKLAVGEGSGAETDNSCGVETALAVEDMGRAGVEDEGREIFSGGDNLVVDEEKDSAGEFVPL